MCLGTIYYDTFTTKVSDRLRRSVAKYAVEAKLPIQNAAKFIDTFLTKPEDIAGALNVTIQITEAAMVRSISAFTGGLKYVLVCQCCFQCPHPYLYFMRS